jgi:hypothetical protein
VVDYRKRAEECFERAARGGRPEDWTRLLEMAKTWEKLADLRELTEKQKASGVLSTKPTPGAE